MTIKAQFISGILFTVSVTSWGVLIWNRFSTDVSGFFVPATIGLILTLAVLASDQ